PYEPEVLRSKVAVFVDLYLKENEIRRQAERLREMERRTLERKSEHRYRALTDAMPLAMWAADAAGSPYFVNRRFSEYTGLSAADMGGDAWWNVIHLDD